MSGRRRAYVHECMLEMDHGSDPAAPGAAVTTALCGSPDHEGPCRWPHHTAASPAGDSLRVRTVFAAAPVDEHEVRSRIARALVEARGWTVIGGAASELAGSEADLGARLLAGPHRDEPGSLTR
jgi:hypothetical protein